MIQEPIFNFACERIVFLQLGEVGRSFMSTTIRYLDVFRSQNNCYRLSNCIGILSVLAAHLQLRQFTLLTFDRYGVRLWWTRCMMHNRWLSAEAVLVRLVNCPLTPITCEP